MKKLAMLEPSVKVKPEEHSPSKKPKKKGSQLSKVCIVCGTSTVKNPAKDWFKGPKCSSCYKKEKYKENPQADMERRRQNYTSNIDREKEWRKQYYIDNKLEIDKRHKEYYKTNKEKVLASRIPYRKNNKKREAQRSKDRRINDVNFRLAGNLRNRLNRAIARGSKTGSAIRDLGISIDAFKQYLESQFEPWMTWDNYGRFNKNKKTWNIDHIKPLVSFDLTNPEQLKIACYYTNLQPILARKNIEKGSNLF